MESKSTRLGAALVPRFWLTGAGGYGFRHLVFNIRHSLFNHRALDRPCGFFVTKSSGLRSTISAKPASATSRPVT